MQKRKLDLDELAVTSFEATAEPGVRGTVAANEMSHLCSGSDSCASSCPNYTCEGATCAFVIC